MYLCMRADPQLRELFDREYSGLVRTAFLVCGDMGVAEEVTQEAFARAMARWRRISSYDRPGAWLRLVAVRLAVRARRRQGRERLDGRLPESGALDPPPPDPELYEALRRLSAPQRRCVVLHHLDDMSVADVADALSMREGTVRSHLHRGRAALAEQLAERPEEGVLDG